MTRSRWLSPSNVLTAKPPSTIVSIARPMKLLSSLARIPRNKTSSVRTGARGDARCSETQVTERHFPTPKPTGAPFRLLRLTLAASNDTTPEGFSETLKAPSRYLPPASAPWDTTPARRNAMTAASARIAIACQGGGSHTAFTAGVLGRLLRRYHRRQQRLDDHPAHIL